MRGAIRALLLAFAFAVPWQYSLDFGEPYGNIARIGGLALLAAAIPAIFLAGGVRTPPTAHWLALAYFLWLCCSVLWSIDEAATLARLRTCFQVMMPFWLIWEFADTSRHLRALLRAYVAGSWVLAVLTILNFASLASVVQGRFAAEGQDPNDVARFLVIGFPFGALLLDEDSSIFWKCIAVGYLPVGLVSVILTASRGGFLVAIIALAGCAAVLTRRHPRAVLVGGASLPAVVAAFPAVVPYATLARIATIPEQLQHGDLNQRLNIWAAAWHAFLKAPFFGSGAGTFVQATRSATLDTAHNTALALTVEGGIISLILASVLIALCIGALRATRGSLRLAMGTAFLVWLVSAMVATVETNRSSWLLLGILLVAARLAGAGPGGVDATLQSAPAGDLA